MKLLGSYQSNLAPFHYEELLKLLETAVELGEYAGNKAFDEQAAANLRSAAQEFRTLPVASAGQRVTDDSMNRPLDLLRARFNALKSEAGDFDVRAEQLISVLEKDAALIDQILAAAGLEAWARTKTPLTAATQTKWDYAMGHGNVGSSVIAPTSPINSVEYDIRPPQYTIMDTSTGEMHTGLISPVSVVSVKPKDLTWTYSTTGESEELFGDDWAKLSLLEERPLVNFVQNPAVEVQLPRGGDISGFFEVTGQVAGGALPIFVRVLFRPRRNKTTVTPSNAVLAGLGTFFPAKPLDKIYIESNITATGGTNGSMKAELALYKEDGTAVLNADGTTMTVPLPPVSPSVTNVFTSGVLTIPDKPEVRKAKLQFTAIGTTVGAWSQNSFRVHVPSTISTNLQPDEVSVYVPNGAVYFPNDDFVADDSGQVTIKGVADGTILSVRYTELFPAYECSVNQSDWSPVVMLDPARPYPDTETKFLPIELTADNNGRRTRFPITDELGVPTGLCLKMLVRPQAEYLFTVTTPAVGVNAGATVTLTVELERPAYINVLSISPFTNFPARIQSVDTQSFTTDTRLAVYSQGNVPGILLDRPVRLKFPRRLIRKLFITLYQENYSLKEHSIDQPDKLRREVLGSLQSSLPNSIRRPLKVHPVLVRGSQYDFGLENIVGEDWNSTLPGVFVAGSYKLGNCPEILRFDAEYQGNPSFYLCYRGYDSAGAVIDENTTGFQISTGSCIVFPWAGGADLSKIVRTDLYLKFLFTTSADMVERFMIQTTHV
jgi:hypothetical protein